MRDSGTDVVPPAAVKAGRVLAELINDLVHLEGGRKRLDELRPGNIEKAGQYRSLGGLLRGEGNARRSPGSSPAGS